MSYSDPGEQDHAKTRRKPRPAAPLPPGDQNDLFRAPTPPKGPSEGEKRKDKALEKHEASGRAPIIRFLRNRLKALYFERSHSDRAFVTADDAAKIMLSINLVDEPEGPRNWFGSIFKAPGWKHTGRSVPSLRPELNGRHVRCWRWQP